MRYLKTFESYNINEKWEISDELEYNGYLIPVYKKDDKEYLGHPRPKTEKVPYMKELIIYDKSKLDKLKNSIDIISKKDFKSGIDNPMFPSQAGKIENPNFKGFALGTY
jgi:hypothetical protein